MTRGTRIAGARALATLVALGLALAAAPVQAGGGSQLSGTVNVNTASVEELQLLPGIGAARARASAGEASIGSTICSTSRESGRPASSSSDPTSRSRARRPRGWSSGDGAGGSCRRPQSAPRPPRPAVGSGPPTGRSPAAEGGRSTTRSPAAATLPRCRAEPPRCCWPSPCGWRLRPRGASRGW
jgi:hypothetical protein